jgi:hypothetical protein
MKTKPNDLPSERPNNIRLILMRYGGVVISAGADKPMYPDELLRACSTPQEATQYLLRLLTMEQQNPETKDV